MSNLATNLESFPLNYVIDEFNGWLSDKSENSAKAYRIDATQFFKVIFKKEPRFVTIEDMYGLKSLDGSRFLAHLKEEGMKNATIKRKFDAITSFINRLKSDYPAINEKVFDKIMLDNPENDRKPWGNIKWYEAQLVWNHAFDKIPDGRELGSLVFLGCVTSMRVEALLSLTWEDHFFVKEEKGIMVDYIDILDKKKRHKKAISKSVYNVLRDNLNHTGKLFPTLTTHMVGANLKAIFTELGFDARRNLSFHSFKKCGVNRIIEKTGNIYKAKEQGNHSSIATTEKYYIEATEDLTQSTSYTIDEEIDVVTALSDFTKEELVLAIAQISEGAKFEIIRKLNAQV